MASLTTSNYGAFSALSVVGYLAIASIATDTPPTQTTTSCGATFVSEFIHATECKEPSLHEKHENVMRELERESELDLTGHPSPYGGFVPYIQKHWHIRTIVDVPALGKHGIRLDDISPYDELRAGGVSRRSSLRFIFDAGGLAYYLDDKTLVVTTKHLAKVKWVAQLDKPEPKGLSAPSVGERREAAFAAGFWHVDPDVWIQPLVAALNDSDRQVCFDAAYALGAMGPQAAPAIERLVSLLKSNDLTLREAAVFALGHIGPKASDSLLELVNDPDSGIALAAAKSFNVMGSAGKQAIPDLIAAAKRHADGEEICDNIGLAISAIDPGGAVPALCELLKSEKSGIRAFAANAIAEIGPLGRVCTQELLPLLTDQNLRVRIRAARALATIDLPADFPTVELEAAVKDPDENVSAWAKEGLRVIKSKK